MPVERNTGVKLTLGLLLVGATALPAGNILVSMLGTTAAGVGINWIAETLGGVFSAGPPPHAHLRAAFINAVRESAGMLREQYGLDRVKHDRVDAFELLRETARDLVTLELPPEARDLETVQRGLAAALTQLLHGYPDAQVTLIKQQLLPSTARAFQAELARNDQAWRLYHGWLIEHMLGQSVAVQAALARQPTARTELADVANLEAHFTQFKQHLEDVLSALRNLLEQAALAPVDPDQNTLLLHQKMEAEAITQAEQQATKTEGTVRQTMRAKTICDSRQIATGVRHPQQPRPAPSPHPDPDPDPRPSEPTVMSLVLRCRPTPAGATMTWEAKRIGTIQSTFFSPYQGRDLDLVLRALEYQQAPTSALSAADLTRLAALDLPTADGMVVPELARAVGQQLYAALTANPSAAQAVTMARNAAIHAGVPFSLSLHLPKDAVNLAALPWELLWVPGEPTPLLLSHGIAGQLIRHLDLAQAFPAPRSDGRPLRVLTIAPHARNTPELATGVPTAQESVWSDLVARGTVTLLPTLSPATLEAVADTLRSLAGQLDLLHLVSHGSFVEGEGYLVLDGPNGNWAPTPISQLAPAIAQTAARLVLLDACQSATVGTAPNTTGLLGGVAPALVAHGIPAVVAMQFTVRQRAAHTTIRVIAEELAAGRTVQAAVVAARLQLWSSEQDRASWYVPTLYVRAGQLHGTDGTMVRWYEPLGNLAI